MWYEVKEGTVAGMTRYKRRKEARLWYAVKEGTVERMRRYKRRSEKRRKLERNIKGRAVKRMKWGRTGTKGETTEKRNKYRQ